MFQSTPLREGRPCRSRRSAIPASFQSTPLREGRLRLSAKYVYAPDVSIHAPARGATGDTGGNKVRSEVSIHAPARGATSISCPSASLKSGFNPRPCARGDELVSTGTREHRVSIHAPARGATQVHKACFLSSEFQSTPLREGRHAKFFQSKHTFEFQSTPLREGRLGHVCW